MRTLAVVPARGGSKGLPGKNARPFLGVSLLERAISIAQETCDDVIVTTDDPELARLAARAGAPIRMRPADLATDEAPMLPVVQDAIRGREGDVIVLLQPTQPLRTVGEVRASIDALTDEYTSVVTVKRVPDAYSPDRLMVIEDGVLAVVTKWATTTDRRQDARAGFARCGTAYVTHRFVLDRSSLYGPLCRPLILPGDALSIDTLEDFERLEALASA